MSQPPPPYGNVPPSNPYGATPYGGGYPPPDHPQAMLVLILGILGIVVCGLAAPFAWVMGNRVVGEIDASGGQMGGRASANAGRICGIIGTCLIGLSLLILVGVFAVVLIGAAQS